MVKSAFGLELLHEAGYGRLYLQFLLGRTDEQPDTQECPLFWFVTDDSFCCPYALSDAFVGIVRSDGPNVPDIIDNSNSRAVTTTGEMLKPLMVPGSLWQLPSCPFLGPLEDLVPSHECRLTPIGTPERRGKAKNLALANHL